MEVSVVTVVDKNSGRNSFATDGINSQNGVIAHEENNKTHGCCFFSYDHSILLLVDT